MTEPTPEVQGQAPEPAPADSPNVTPSSAEKGFPEGTPLDAMTSEQREAYWKHYARKHESAVKEYGLTPQQVADLQTEVETLREKSLSADEKLLKAARSEAYKQAQADAEAKYLPQIRAAKVQSIASQIVSGDRLSAFLELVDTSRLLGEDGQVDESKVMGYLTAMYGTTESQPPSGQRWANFGQYTSPPPRGKPGAAGLAEAQKRFGTNTH